MDLASSYLSGVRQVQEAEQAKAELRQRAVEANMRQQQAQQALAAETAARQQQNEREALIESQRIAVETQIQEQRLDLQRQALQDKQKQAAETAKQSAEVIAQTRGFYQAINSGMPTFQAAALYPKAHQGAISQSGIDSRSAERIAEKRREDQMKIEQQFTKQTEARHAAELKDEMKQSAAKRAAQAKEEAIPSVSVKLPGDGGSMRLPANSPRINQLLGDNAPPGLGTNYDANVPSVEQSKKGKRLVWDPDKGQLVDANASKEN